MELSELRKDTRSCCVIASKVWLPRYGQQTQYRGLGAQGTDGEMPYLQVGVYDKERAAKKGLKHAYYAGFQEFGTSKMSAANGGRGFIRPAVMDSIDEVRIIQGKYLSEIENENRAMGLINEGEEIADD